jgi:hypothetical protein
MSDDKKSVTRFLNVDVDLRCKQGLDELLGYFEPAVLILYRTTEEASMELNESHRSHQAYFAISSETIARIAPLGFEIVFTLYAPVNDGDGGS